MKHHLLKILCLLLCVSGCQSGTEFKITNSQREPINISAQDSFPCVHCNGMGNRMNQLTGEFGICASCSGTGKVDQFRNDQNVKEYSAESVSVTLENNYTCPRCGGLGLETTITDYGMNQTQCVICNGSGKVNEWIYENYKYQ